MSEPPLPVYYLKDGWIVAQFGPRWIRTKSIFVAGAWLNARLREWDRKSQFDVGELQDHYWSLSPRELTMLYLRPREMRLT